MHSGVQRRITAIFALFGIRGCCVGSGPGCKSPANDSAGSSRTRRRLPVGQQPPSSSESWTSGRPLLQRTCANLKVAVFSSGRLGGSGDSLQQKLEGDQVEKGNEKVAELEAAGLKAYAEASERGPAAHAVLGQAGGRCNSARRLCLGQANHRRADRCLSPVELVMPPSWPAGALRLR